MMKAMKNVLVAAIVALQSGAARAADDAFEFFEEEAKAIRIASARPETVFNSVSNVTVIDRRMIETYNYESVADALEAVAGVMVWRTYAMQRVPTFRGALQEHYANKVLVMIDNVPAWNAVTGEGDVDRVGIDSVERIEILRGPASVLYGSNALTGVVNIVLRRPENGTPLTVASAGVATGHGRFSAAAEVSRVAGVYSRADDDSGLFLSADFSSRRAPTFAFTDDTRTTFELNEYFVVRNVNAHWRRGGHSLLANLSNGVQDYGGNAISLASGAGKPHDKEMALVSYSHAFGPSWSALKYTGTVDRQRRQIPRDAADSLRSDILGTRYVNALTAEFELPGAFSLEVGGSHDYRAAERYNNFVSTSQAVVADNKMDDRLVWEGALFSQLLYGGEPWKLVLGARYTHNAAFGDDLSSRLSAVYMINEGNSLKFMAGQSFRAPTPFELYFQNDPVTVLGNPGVKPEKTSSVEASYLTSRGRMFGQATLYYVDYLNTIVRNRGDFTRDGQAYLNANFYDNARRYDAKGAELEARYSSRRFGSFVAFNYIHGGRGDEREVAAPGVFGLPGGQASNFRFVPRYTLSAGVSGNAPSPYGAGELFGSVVAHHYSSMETVRSRLPPKAWADVSVGFKRGGLRHAVTLRNATGSAIVVPEYVRQRVVESMPLVNGRRFDYTIAWKF